MKRREGAAVRAMVAGNRGVETVRRARISTIGKRTLISSRLAASITDLPGPRRCTDTTWAGRVCGPTVPISVFVDNCRAAKLRAVVVPLPNGFDLAVGRDLLTRTVRKIDFSTVEPTIYCRRKRRY